MSASNTGESELLTAAFITNPGAHGAALYIALSTADPGETGAGLAEPAGGAYARVAKAPGTTHWNNPTGTAPTKITNKTDVDFGTATASWGTITHFAILDAASGGDVLYSAALTTAKAVANGDPVKFPAGDLEITFD